MSEILQEISRTDVEGGISKLLSLEEIKSEIDDRAQRIGASGLIPPTGVRKILLDLTSKLMTAGITTSSLSADKKWSVSQLGISICCYTGFLNPSP